MHYDVLAGNNCIRLSMWDGDILRLILELSPAEDQGRLDLCQPSRGVDDRHAPERRVGLALADLPRLKTLYRFIGRHIDEFEQPTLPGLFDPDLGS